MIALLINGNTVAAGSCICSKLRACEQRCDEKRHAEVRAWSELSRDNFDHGFAAGLDAAREAVAALDAFYAIEECQGNPLRKGDPEDPDPWHQGHLIERDDALAAIDALREDRQKPPPLPPSVGVPERRWT